MTTEETTQDPNKPRCCAIRMGMVLWILWSVLGWMAYHLELSAGKTMALAVFAAPNSIPALLEQWLTTQGFGGAERPGQVPYSFILFLAWGLFLWLPVFALRNPKRSRLRGWLIELALLILVSIPFLFSGLSRLNTESTAMQRRMTIRLSVMMFLQYAVPAATFPILSHYLKNVLLFDGKQTGIILAMPAAAAMVTPLLASRWADRLISAERLMALCHLLAAFAMIWMRQMDTFWGVLIAYFCYGLAFTPTFGLTNAIGMHNVENVKRDFGGIRGWGTFGWVVLSFAFAYFWLKGGDGSGARLADGMYVAAIISLLLAVYSLTFKPVINHEGAAPIAYGEVLKIFRRPSLLLLCVATFVNSTCHMSFYFGMGLQMHQMGYADSSIQPLMSIGQATEVILLWTLGWFLVRLGMKRAMIIALLAQFLRMILFATESPVGLIIGIALHGIIFAFYFTTAYLYLDSHCTPKTRAGAQQVLTLIHAGIGSCTGFILFGYIVEWAKRADGIIDFRFFWGGPAVISIGLALVLALFFKEETKPSP